tara:strand:- start:63925 stop:64332 length:408 start_codon:yes stop_codon:yes gene_type:complete
MIFNVNMQKVQIRKLNWFRNQNWTLKLIEFLEKPIDLQKFKKKKDRDVITSLNNGLEYQYHSKIKDSVFYGYNFLTEDLGTKGINEIVVFKYVEHKYEDETEILIELRIFNKDSDLGKANLIGFFKNGIGNRIWL